MPAAQVKVQLSGSHNRAQRSSMANPTHDNPAVKGFSVISAHRPTPENGQFSGATTPVASASAPADPATPGANAANVSAATASQSAPSASPDMGATSAKAAAASRLDALARDVKPFLDEHGHALVYGLVGLVAAILILTIGILPVLLLAALSAIGIAIGRYRDGDVAMHNAAGSLARMLSR